MTPADMVVSRQGLRFAGRRFACSIGRGGVTRRKREGDRATPAGAMGLIGCWYRPDRMARPVDWAEPILPGMAWCESADDPAYNRLVRSHSAGDPMRRADPLYDLVLATDWNWHRPVPGAGSAIFVHRWRRPGWPTAGCVALAPGDLDWIVRHLTPQSRLIVLPRD